MVHLSGLLRRILDRLLGRGPHEIQRQASVLAAAQPSLSDASTDTAVAPENRTDATSPLGDWIPNWKYLVSQAPELWANTDPPLQKILICTVTGGHDAVTPIESMLAVALKLRRAEVHVLVCDGVLPACLQTTVAEFPDADEFLEYGPQKSICDGCCGRGMIAFDIPGVVVQKFSEWLSEDDRKAASEFSASVPVLKLTTCEFRGIPVGDHAKAATLRFFVRGILETDPQCEAVLRRYVEASALAVIVSQKLYAHYDFQGIAMNHGIYVPHGPLAAVARSQGRRMVAWSLSYRSRCAIFSHDDSDIFTLIDEPNEKWEDMHWDEQAESDIMEYLDSRSTSGKKDWLMPFHADSERDLQLLSGGLKIDFAKPTIGLCTNVIWDAALCFSANAFSDMVDWLIKTIRYFTTRQDLQLLIRIHPAEVKMNTPSRQRALDEILSVFPQLPPNIFIVPAESDANTYVLMEQCRAVLIYGTTMGMELSSRGIPVVVAGQAWVRNKGIVREASSEAEYMAILEELPFAERRMSPAQIRRARMYAYHFYMRRMIPLEPSFARNGWPFLGVRVGSLEELLPGKAPGIDIICSGILNGSDLIYKAELVGRDAAVVSNAVSK